MIHNIVLIAATVVLFSYKDVSDYVPFTVEGVVKDKSTGKPLRNVHVFTVKGEEEAVTDAKGLFHFESWKEAVVLRAEVEGYKRVELRLKLPALRQTILLTSH